MDEFKREERYIVFKIKDVDAFFSDFHKKQIEELIAHISWHRKHEKMPELSGVFIERDWPMYEDTWKAIQEYAETGKYTRPSSLRDKVLKLRGSRPESGYKYNEGIDDVLALIDKGE